MTFWFVCLNRFVSRIALFGGGPLGSRLFGYVSRLCVHFVQQLVRPVETWPTFRPSRWALARSILEQSVFAFESLLFAFRNIYIYFHPDLGDKKKRKKAISNYPSRNNLSAWFHFREQWGRRKARIGCVISLYPKEGNIGVITRGVCRNSFSTRERRINSHEGVLYTPWFQFCLTACLRCEELFFAKIKAFFSKPMPLCREFASED